MNSDPHCGCQADNTAVPSTTDNPPNQDAVQRRIGTHGSFMAGLATALAGEPGLDRLTARDPSDPAIAILDAWATVGDVLTFYQERCANEAFLCTATERRSISELARLVGYRLREGVSASVPLSFTIDPSDPTLRATILAGTPAQSLPKPGEQPQTFETSDPLVARSEWNRLPVRQTRPQVLKKADVLA